MQLVPKDSGWIEVICGPMFSGKTEELIKRLRKAVIARQKVKVFKPALDTRFHEEQIVSHSDQKLLATPLAYARAMLEHVDEALDVVGVDEAQFFDEDLADVCERLANMGKRVICAGLDLDYKGEPFGSMPRLLTIAEFVTKSNAICVKCGSPASRSQRITPSTEKVVLGATESYEARCRKCHNPSEPSAPGDQLYLIELSKLEGRGGA